MSSEPDTTSVPAQTPAVSAEASAPVPPPPAPAPAQQPTPSAPSASPPPPANGAVAQDAVNEAAHASDASAPVEHDPDAVPQHQPGTPEAVQATQPSQSSYDLDVHMQFAVAAAAAAAADPRRSEEQVGEAGAAPPPAPSGWSYPPGFDVLQQQAGMAGYGAVAPAPAMYHDVKPARDSTKRYSLYNTGGNTNGRKPWLPEETGILMKSLDEICVYKREYPAIQPYAIVLRWHGPSGERSSLLSDRNNMQLKDKSRNELLRMKRANEPIPFWKNILHKTLWNDATEEVIIQPAPPMPPVEDALANGWHATDLGLAGHGSSRRGNTGTRRRARRSDDEIDDEGAEERELSMPSQGQDTLAQILPPPPMSGMSDRKRKNKKRKELEEAGASAEDDATAMRQQIEAQAATAAAAAAHLHLQAQQAAAAYTAAAQHHVPGRKNAGSHRRQQAKIAQLHAAAHQTAQAAAQASVHAWHLHMQRFLPDPAQAQNAASTAAAQAAAAGQAMPGGMDMVQLQAQMQQYAAQQHAAAAAAAVGGEHHHKKRKHKRHKSHGAHATSSANEGEDGASHGSANDSATQAANQALQSLESGSWNLSSLVPSSAPAMEPPAPAPAPASEPLPAATDAPADATEAA